jgi:hypothetical protein
MKKELTMVSIAPEVCSRMLAPASNENNPNPIQTCTQHRHLLMLSIHLYHKVLVHWQLSSLLPTNISTNISTNLSTVTDRGAAMNWDSMLLGYCCVTSNTMSHLPIQGEGIHNRSNEIGFLGENKQKVHNH